MIRFLFLTLFFIISVFADVRLISRDYFYENEPFIFEIEVNGEDIEFPKIDLVDGNIVQNLGTNRTITSINGKVKTLYKKSFKLLPKDSFTLPSFDIKVDGKVFKTDSKLIEKKSIQKSKSNDFDLELEVDKSSLYVGESTNLILRFSQNKELEVVDLALSMPKYKNIWMKRVDGQNSYEKDNKVVQEIKYILYPQKSGNLRLSPAKVIVKTLSFNSYSNFSSILAPTKDINIFSNAIDLKVKDLPNGVNLIGEFLISSEVNKRVVKANEPINYKIKISGYGNIDDLKDLKLNIPNVTIYENKPVINKKVENEIEKFNYEKSFSIISSKDYKIPSISFDFFDKNIEKIVTQKTDEYKISVENLGEVSKPKLEKIDEEVKIKEKIVYQSSNSDKILFFIFGIIATLLIFGLYIFVKNRRPKSNDDLPIIKKIKSKSTSKEILNILIPYLGRDERLDEKIFILEKDENCDLKKEKKDIISLIKELKI